MALSNVYVQVYGQLPDLFHRLSEGQAPEKVTRQYLKDLGFASSNFHATIPMLKALGFLSSDGIPTHRYFEYRNTALSKRVMADALREAYGDLFTIKANPTESDRQLIEGKFRSVHNATPNTAKLMTSTFYALLGLADLSATPAPMKKEDDIDAETSKTVPITEKKATESNRPSLNYTIQIHLPATKDIEVFNAIFKSLKEHLID